MGDWWPARYSGNPATLVDVVAGSAVGEPVVMRHSDSGDDEWGRVTSYEPGSRFAQTFTLAMSHEHPSELVVDFAPSGDGTLLTFSHEGWTAENASYRGKFTEWPLILDEYVASAESQRG